MHKFATAQGPPRRPPPALSGRGGGKVFTVAAAAVQKPQREGVQGEAAQDGGQREGNKGSHGP